MRAQILGKLVTHAAVVALASTAVIAVRLDGPGTSPGAASGVVAEPAAAPATKGRPLRGVETPIGSALRSRGATGVIRPGDFSQVAVTWRGEAPAVEVSTHTRGAWTGWTVLEEFDDIDLGEGDGTRGTELRPVGPSDAVRVRVTGGGARDLQVVTIDPGTVVAADDLDLAAASVATADSGTSVLDPLDSPPSYTPPSSYAPKPEIKPRKKWGADESLRGGPAQYNKVLQQVHVHHTAGTNSYTMQEVPGIIRGMYWYHTQSLGWNDIGYNFLIDKWGRLWEGRWGGWVTHPTRGAHTLGFNHNSTGVALLGNFEKVAPTRAAITKLVRFAAWKLDYHRRQPAGWITALSGGSDRFPRGEYVRLPVIDGHRHTNETACPGRYLYAKLHSVRERAQARADAY